MRCFCKYIFKRNLIIIDTHFSIYYNITIPYIGMEGFNVIKIEDKALASIKASGGIVVIKIVTSSCG